jgi:hypothetical protein
MAAAAARCAAAADALSDLDLVDRTLMSTQSWSLLPLEACLAVSAGAMCLIAVFCDHYCYRHGIGAVGTVTPPPSRPSHHPRISRFPCARNASLMVQRSTAPWSGEHGMEVSGAFGEDEHPQQATSSVDGDAYGHARSQQWEQDGPPYFRSPSTGTFSNNMFNCRSVCGMTCVIRCAPFAAPYSRKVERVLKPRLPFSTST